jgi:hypothetical protein
MMQPRPFHTRTELIALAREFAPTRACWRAMIEDRATVLGGFITPGGLPSWLVQVDSRHGNRWYVGLVCDEDNNCFRPWWPETPDWANWDGRINGRSLRDGDSPNTFALRRAQAKARESDGPNNKARAEHGTPLS